ncbi:MAG: DinB family protein [Vicinamibacterales bacterium]
MNLQELRTLVDYHYWARDRLFDAVERLSPEQFGKALGNSFPSIRDTLVHLYGADRIWCDRWEGASPRSMPDAGGFPDLASIRVAWTEQERKVRALLERLGEQGVDRPIEYRTMDGQLQAQPFWQMLQHLVNHGSYHRGQVTTMMRQLGEKPPKSMDLIAFYRERSAAALR